MHRRAQIADRKERKRIEERRKGNALERWKERRQWKKDRRKEEKKWKKRQLKEKGGDSKKRLKRIETTDQNISLE